MDCVFTHPAAALYAQGASQLGRFAAAKAETSKPRAFVHFSDGAGYEFVLLAIKSFGWLGKEAASCLSDLSFRYLRFTVCFHEDGKARSELCTV